MEIKPGGEDIQGDYPLSSFDPCGNYPTEENHQVVYSCSMYPVEPYQQLFPFQGGGNNIAFHPNRYYQIEIIEGSDYAYMERAAYQDTLGVYHPSDYLGSYLTGIRGDELSGSGDYIALFDPNNPAIQRAGTYLRENPSLYYIYYNSYEQTETDVTVKITDLDSNIVTYWYTKVVNPQLVIANQQLENDTVLHYYSKDVSIKLDNTKFPCMHPGYGGCPPDNVTFNIEITQGQQYGIIKNSETEETNTSFTGLSWEEISNTIFTYYANGIQPDSAATVRIRHSSSDAEIPSIEYEFTVKRNTIPPPSEGGAIYIQLDKKQVMPSDTINIYLKWINEVRDTNEFAPIQRFQIELAEGAEYGRLLDVESGQEGDYFGDAGRELKLIIEENIEPEIAKITIVAQCDLLIWGGRIPISGKVKLKEEEATERNKRKEPITPEFIIVGDHLVGIEEVIINKTPIVVEIIPEEISAGDTARIVIKKRQADGTIVELPAEQQFEIGMLEGCLLGKLSSVGIDTNYINGATQPIYFIADSSADSGVVKIRVGLKDSSTTGNRNNKGRITTEAGEYCFLNTFESLVYKDAEVRIVVDECEEPTKMCMTNEPQQTDTSSFNLLRSNQLWTWFDELNNPKSANIFDACIYYNGESHPLGITKFLYKIAGLEEDYIFLQDLIINVCLDTSEEESYKWIFNVDNLRIPVICDYCFQPSLIDLIDGSNESVLSANISSCDIYREVIDVLEWFIIGPYSQQDDTLSSNFVFSSGVRKHEYKHFLDYRTHTKNDMDTIAFKEIRNIERLKEIFPCPEEAFDLNAKAKINAEILKSISRGQNIKKIMGRSEIITPKGNKFIVPESELKADEYASEHYETIKERIYNWVKQQSWYKENENCVQE